MTIRELIEIVCEGEEPSDSLARECFLAIAGAVRSQAQGEPSTFEGEVAGAEALILKFGLEPTWDGWLEFTRRFPGLLDHEIPLQTIYAWAKADSEG